MHDPRRRMGIGAPRSTLLVLLSLLLAASLGACGKKKEKTPSPREPLTWNGLALGMPAQNAKDRLKALGATVTCQPASTVMFLDAGTLTTLWVKQAARSRTERCDAVRPAARAKATDQPRGLIRAKLFFLDGTLRQLNVVLGENDGELGKAMEKRWGPPEQTSVSVRLYSGKMEGSIRVFQYKDKERLVMWLRKASLQELIFLAHLPEAVAPLQQISSQTKEP